MIKAAVLWSACLLLRLTCKIPNGTITLFKNTGETYELPIFRSLPKCTTNKYELFTETVEASRPSCHPEYTEMSTGFRESDFPFLPGASRTLATVFSQNCTHIQKLGKLPTMRKVNGETVRLVTLNAMNFTLDAIGRADAPTEDDIFELATIPFTFEHEDEFATLVSYTKRVYAATQAPNYELSAEIAAAVQRLPDKLDEKSFKFYLRFAYRFGSEVKIEADLGVRTTILIIHKNVTEMTNFRRLHLDDVGVTQGAVIQKLEEQLRTDLRHRSFVLVNGQPFSVTDPDSSTLVQKIRKAERRPVAVGIRKSKSLQSLLADRWPGKARNVGEAVKALSDFITVSRVAFVLEKQGFRTGFSELILTELLRRLDSVCQQPDFVRFFDDYIRNDVGFSKYGLTIYGPRKLGLFQEIQNVVVRLTTVPGVCVTLNTQAHSSSSIYRVNPPDSRTHFVLFRDAFCKGTSDTQNATSTFVLNRKFEYKSLIIVNS